MSTSPNLAAPPRSGSAGQAITIRVNDEPRAIATSATLADVVRELGLAERKGVAIAVNDKVVPRAAWAAQGLAAGDHVLVIRATQGG